LRYEPDVDHGAEIPLASSASGLAWLSQLQHDDALRLVARQQPEKRHLVSIAGPGPQLTDDRMELLAPSVQAAAVELSGR
jgi:hypothetical protein